MKLPEQLQIYVFHQFELVDKFDLETENPRRDISILSVSAGMPLPGLVKTAASLVNMGEYIRSRR